MPASASVGRLGFFNPRELLCVDVSCADRRGAITDIRSPPPFPKDGRLHYVNFPIEKIIIA